MGYLIIVIVALLTVSTGNCGDRSTARTEIRPHGVPGKVVPEKQTEGHTCGWHSVRSIYHSYGLVLEDYNLRERLGVDRKSVPFFTSSKGTVHPDILRVLDQDGFSYEHVAINDLEQLHKLHLHLEHGFSALVLINRRQNDALHWVVFSGMAENRYTIADSLEENLYFEDLLFLAGNVRTVLLVKPRADDAIGKGKSHRKGLWQGFKSLF